MSGAIITEKKCTKCMEVKPLAAFRVDTRGKFGRRSNCAACDHLRREQWRKTPRGKAKIAAQRRAWKRTPKGAAYTFAKEQQRFHRTTPGLPPEPLSPQQYEEMRDGQENRCAICGGDNGKSLLCVDHSHATGKIRGLLCRRCNWGLGNFLDNPELLLSAHRYLVNGSR